MKSISVYRKPNSLDFGTPPTVSEGAYRGLIEITIQELKDKYVLFVGSDTLLYYREFIYKEPLDYWVDNVAFGWEDVTAAALEACGFIKAH